MSVSATNIAHVYVLPMTLMFECQLSSLTYLISMWLVVECYQHSLRMSVSDTSVAADIVPMWVMPTLVICGS